MYNIITVGVFKIDILLHDSNTYAAHVDTILRPTPKSDIFNPHNCQMTEIL